MYHVASLPAPFPIRIPFGLRESGKWGKIETQKDRRVTSDLREERFRKSLRRYIRLADTRNGFNMTNATLP